jgi:hypothetical protein
MGSTYPWNWQNMCLNRCQMIADLKIKMFLPNRIAVILSCLLGYLGKNLYSSKSFESIQLKKGYLPVNNSIQIIQL